MSKLLYKYIYKKKFCHYSLSLLFVYFTIHFFIVIIIIIICCHQQKKNTILIKRTNMQYLTLCYYVICLKVKQKLILLYLWFHIKHSALWNLKMFMSMSTDILIVLLSDKAINQISLLIILHNSLKECNEFFSHLWESIRDSKS